MRARIKVQFVPRLGPRDETARSDQATEGHCRSRWRYSCRDNARHRFQHYLRKNGGEPAHGQLLPCADASKRNTKSHLSKIPQPRVDSGEREGKALASCAAHREWEIDVRFPNCGSPIIEIDRFGERLIGCTSAIDGRGQQAPKVSPWRCPKMISARRGRGSSSVNRTARHMPYDFMSDRVALVRAIAARS